MTPPTNNAPTSPWRRRLIPFLWIVPVGFYAYTACRGAGWIDAPMIAHNVFELKIGTWVNNHNLFHVLGRAWTMLVAPGDFHYRLNLLCALFGGLTVYFVFLTGLRITSNPAAAAFGAAALLFSHSLWWHSTILEVYTLNTALLGLILHFLVRYDEGGNTNDLYKAVFCFGLAAANHVLMGLFLFAFLVLPFLPSRRKQLLRPGVLLALAVCFLAGFQLYLLALLKDFGERLKTLPNADYATEWRILRGILSDATGGHFRKMMFPENVSPASRLNWRLNYVFLLFMNYPSLAFPLGWLGLYAFWKKRAFRFSFWFFLAGLTAQAAWSSNYLIWDMYAFALPVWVLFGLSVILGFDLLWRKGPAFRKALAVLSVTLLVGPYLYARIPDWARQKGFWSRYFKFFHYVSNVWEPAKYLANPDKRGYRETEEFVRGVLQKLPVGSHLYDDDGKGYYPLALYYQKVLGERRDLRHHLIFGPQLTNPRVVALEIRSLLREGQTVYISSPYWPERPVLNELYSLLSAPETRSPAWVDRLPVERLESTFPQYRLERVPVVEGKPFFIYRFQKRGDVEAAASDWVVEGEHLPVLSVTGGSHDVQTMGAGWSNGAQLIWLNGKPGDVLETRFSVPRDMTAEVFGAFTSSYDFGRYRFSLDGTELPVFVDGYSPSTEKSGETLLASLFLARGDHSLKIRIEGAHPGAEKKYGLGLDYLRVRERTPETK